MSQARNDDKGYVRGAKGYAKSGKWDKDVSPLPVSFDRAKQQGPKSDGGNDGGFAPKNRGSCGVKT